MKKMDPRLMSGSPAPVLITDAIFARIIYTILLARQGDFEPQKNISKRDSGDGQLSEKTR